MQNRSNLAHKLNVQSFYLESLEFILKHSDVDHVQNQELFKNNKQGSPCLYVEVWFWTKAAFFPKATTWISSCSVSTAARRLRDLLVSAEPPLLFPLIRREAYCTNCDVARVDFSRGGWFPSDGSRLKRSIHSLLLNPTLYRDIPYCIFKMLHKELPVG